ncbi:hypothetical protein N9R71_00905 [Candidatus Poseidoniales archaeon]|nr:hypothetical protein [Candidatus Poseidoniales archaeon]
MSSRPARAVAFVLVLLLASLSPLATPASAHSAILLDVDAHHVVLEPGQSSNVTLTIENNGSSIRSYNVSTDTGVLPSLWSITATEPVVENIFPTWSKNTTIVVQLSVGAVPADSGSFNIHVTEPTQNITSIITVYVSVAPSYAPLISFDTMGSSLVSMDAGELASFSVDVTNAGSVEDTLLLDVEFEPDLATWWSNQGSNSTGNGTGGNGTGTGNGTGGNGTGTGNGTGGNGTGTGNGTGGNGTGSGNGTGGNGTGSGNGTGGNGTGGNGSSNITVLSNLLMYGNSYTGYNNLASLMESLGVVNADSITPGGKMLSGHWDDINTSLHISNTTLRNPNIDWDYVVLQDQSQVPSLPTTDTFWQASMNGAVNISTEVTAEGSETVLFMTWGRRSGESGPQWHQYSINQNYTIMQDRLADGYTYYAENISAAGNTVWIAPVGLAFKTIHDEVMDSGSDPTQSGNLFYDLYDADGSHPSLKGSYLAACVLYATMTGESPVGSNDTVSINATVKLQLQEAAADTVFNGTSHIDYPWSSTITATSSARGLGGGIPAGWNVQWSDDQLDAMAAGTTQQATLDITVPADVAPDYYGFRLFAASTQGNISTSTLLVVHIDEDHSLSIAFLDQDSQFLPGMTTNTSVSVTNTGNAETDYDWNVEALSGPCAFALPDAVSLALLPDATIDVTIQVDVPATATIADSCEFHFEGSTLEGTSAVVTGAESFTIAVDELVDFELIPTNTQVEVEPGTPQTYTMRLQNNGSETRTFNLQIESTEGLNTIITSITDISILAGESGTWEVQTTAEEGAVGMYVQAFSVTRNGVVSEASVDIEVLATSEITVAGPIDGRIVMQPGTTSSTVFTLSNTGTRDVILVASMSGLPSSATAEISHSSLMLSVGETSQVYLNITLTTNAEPGTHPLEFGYGGTGASAVEQVDLQIQDRYSVLLSSTSTQVVAGPSNNASILVDVTNFGTASDVLQLSLSDSSDSTWFTYSLSTTSVSLASGATSTVLIEVREVMTGATANGVTITLHATSSNDPSAIDHLNLTVRPQVAGAEITVIADVDETPPGGIIRGSVVVKNTGTAYDELLLTTVDMDCGVTTLFELEAGASSPAIPWSCTIDEGAQSGLASLEFRVTSTSRSDYVETYAEIYSVEPTYANGNVLDITTDASTYKIPYSGGTSVVVTVTNLANTHVEGVLSYNGEGTGMLIGQWTRILDDSAVNTFQLAPFASAEFMLTLTSNIENDETANIVLKATYEIIVTSTTGSEESDQFSISIAGPAEPPQGVTLPLGIQLGQSTTLNTLFGGWAFAILLLSVMYLRRNRKVTQDVDDKFDPSEEVVEEESDAEEQTLGYNECRMEDGKVSCPSCEARLGVPRGSEAPFRFTCPKCQTMIRVVE